MNTRSKKSMVSTHGVFLCHKPSGMTSNRVLQTVKDGLRVKKAGHTGALDPLATGVLPLCFGEATKFSQFGLESVKCYRVEAQFGVITETGDSDGEVCDQKPRPEGITESDVKNVIASFVGVQDQTPSIYSALKYQGRPLYEYARKGVDVPISSRKICISEITVESVDMNHGTMQLWVCASKGTYIRSLVQDIGNAIGWGAHVTKLHRTNAGYFNDNSCHDMNLNWRDSLAGESMLPISSLLIGADWWFVNQQEQLDLLVNGHAIELDTCTQVNFLKNHMIAQYQEKDVYLVARTEDQLMKSFYQKVQVEKGVEKRNLVVLYTPRLDTVCDVEMLQSLNAEESPGSLLMLRGIVEETETHLQPRRMVSKGIETF